MGLFKSVRRRYHQIHPFTRELIADGAKIALYLVLPILLIVIGYLAAEDPNLQTKVEPMSKYIKENR